VNRQVRPRAQVRRPAPPAGRRRVWPKLDLPKVVGIIFVALIVCSLIGAGLGNAFFDALGDDDPPDPAEESRRTEQAWREEIERDPNDTVAMLALANLLANNGQLDEAITWYERALALDPENWGARFDFAQSLAEGGKHADAELQYRKVIEAQPDNERYHYFLADLYLNWQPPRTEEAIREYQAAIAAAPDSVIADEARAQLTALGVDAGTPPATPNATPAAS
jgi:tetratricopeptide (TPR) repeat protein